MKKIEPIYLDYAATTPVDPRVVKSMNGCLEMDGAFANPSSIHLPGQRAAQMVSEARAAIAARIHVRPQEIVFTSGATESDNLALKGILMGRGDRYGHLITVKTEHKAVLDTAKVLDRAGFEVTYLDCDSTGLIEVRQVADALKENTILVSVMHVNNEIGVIQPLPEIGQLCRSKGVLFHVDAAQSIGKVPLPLNEWCIDLVSLTSHKVYGPKGIGALYLHPSVQITPLVHGGEQERGLRAGTLSTHQIVGFGKAFELADTKNEAPKLEALRARLWEGLKSIDGVRLNGHPDQRSPNILNVAIPGVEGESLRLATEDIAVSSGAACNTDSPEASYVLKALGLSDSLAQGSLRFSVGRFTTIDDIDRAIALMKKEVARLRVLASFVPNW